MEMTQCLDDDLSRMDDLSVDNIQKCLKSRYERDLIYTNVSDILIAVNPCKALSIYEDKNHAEYRPDNYDPDQRPHIFQVATAAYKRMWETDTNQVIIVSGESGAGKTESTKYMVKHMVYMCNKGQSELHDKIVEINPLLEAFGNAKTTMNENSSRYAKYLELSFNDNEGLAGVVVRDYMLEKSRVVHQNDGEGIFHFFYALFAGCPSEMMNDLFLEKPARSYRILQSDDESLSMTDKYQKMYNDSMSIMGKLDIDREILHVILAAVVLIADIDFYEDAKGSAQITPDSEAPFEHAAMLLNLDVIEFGEALVASTKTVKGTTMATWKTVSQAKDGRDALAKMLYERMFGWLVRMINSDLHPNREGSNIHASIGILDIAGFEKLRTNSFEQLCINLVNEKLQNFMNNKIFKLEMDIYKQEGIQLDGIDFKNNEPLLEMFDTPRVGVLAILDENAKLAHGSDEGFVKQLRTQYSGSPLFTETQSNRPEFFITHFAAMVLYNADGFVEKNRDRLNEELVNVMRKSTNDFINDLFTIKRGPTGTISMETNFDIRKSKRTKPGVPVMLEGKQKLKPTPKGAELAAQLGKSLNLKFHNVFKPSNKSFAAASQQTLVSCFKASLGQLLEKLGDGNPFFVRCVKANQSLSPNLFEETVVKDQLTYNGLAEIAKIRKMGFDVRKNKEEFFSRYRFLFTGERLSDPVQKIVKQIPSYFHQQFRCGRTKIFMTSELHSWFERALICRRNAAALKVISVVRQVGDIKHQERLERQRLEELRLKREAEEAAARQRQSFKEFGTNELRSTRGGQGENDSGWDSPEPSTSTGSTTSTPGSSADFDKSPNPLRETVPPGDVEYRPPSPVSHIDDTRTPAEENEENEKKSEKERSKDGLEFWDVCQIIARERKIRDVDEDRGLQVVKVLTYFLIFCILFFCAVAQKISLVLLVRIPYNRTADRETDQRDEDALVGAARHILITIAILIPYCLIFITSMFKWMFGNFQMPNVSSFVWCVFTEMLHSIGLCLLCFMVLPEMDIILGLFVINGVAIIPSVIFPVCGSAVKLSGQTKATMGHRIIVHALNILVLLLQFGYIPVILLTEYFSEVSLVDKSDAYTIFFVLSMVFMSFSWWENFVDDRFCGNTSPRSCWKQTVLKLKFDLQESRPVISTLTSLIKIGVTILMSYLTKGFLEVNTEDDEKYIAGISMSDVFSKLGDMDLTENTSILVLTLCTFVGHYVGYTACKLKLQRFSFNIPLLLSTPVAVIILVLECSDIDILGVFTDEYRECSISSISSIWIQYLYGILVWISLYWLCRHIFYPNIERLAKTERLFINPFYCGILFEQHLLMNRRRHTRKIYKEIRDDNVTYRLSEYNSKITIEGDEEDDRSTDGKSSTEDVNDDNYRNPKFREIPMIYACATMWHETKYEMIQLMKSIYRMDRDQCIRKTAEELFGKEDKDFYDFEAHVLFDDAMTLNDDEEMVPNDFVMTLVRIMDEAASSVYGKAMTLRPPYKIPTPYGGQIIFTLPGENLMFVHLKDKTKIRHRKRWSQVMYMYYLLGFRIVRMSQEVVKKALNEGKINALCTNWGGEDDGGRVFKSHIFRAFDDQMIQKASNTFLLALDGDVDFSPGAVRLLLDRMRKSEKVGAACGRIHPIGTGPVVWFQKFEYAIAHWLQKATEHVLGCVLCSPGCFSMFRGSALMDDNVMKKYTILPTEAAHHLMYDQGEDRWLCTLLLQQGYRVDYAAGSDAFTYAPEGFAEFFNQRRRWMPSTVFNIVDLLADYKNTVYVNTNISMLYILYQGGLLLSTVVGPATVLMMIATANTVVFKVSIIWGYVIALAPAVFYFIVCFYVKPKVQIQVAEVLTGLYAFVMMIVLVGTIVTAVKSSPFHPSVVFLAFLVIAFSFSAILHPKEWSCIVFGALYFLLIPTGFLLLNIYSLCNLHVVSWGTREVPKKKTKAEEEEAKRLEEEKKKKKKEQGFFGKFFPQFPAKDFKDMFTKLIETQGRNQATAVDSSETNKLLKEMNDHLKDLVQNRNAPPPAPEHRVNDPSQIQDPPNVSQTRDDKPKGILKRAPSEHKHVGIADSVKIIDEDRDEIIYDRVKRDRDDLINPAWAEVDELKKGKTLQLAEEEMTFWKGFLEKYLKPLDYSDEKKKNDAAALIDLRNNIALGMAMINMLWIAINFMFQFESPTTISLPLTESLQSDSPADLEENLGEEESETADNILEVDLLGLLFIFFYLGILLLQFFGMLVHRWGTLLHLVSVTKLKNPFREMWKQPKQTQNEEFDPKTLSIEASKNRKFISTIVDEPEPDYSSSSDDEQAALDVERQLKDLQRTGTRFQMEVSKSNIGATSRTLNRLDLDETMRKSIARSTRKLRSTMLSHSRRNVVAPDGDQLRDQVMRYNKYSDRPLPPVRKRKGRINFGPGRSELLSRLNDIPSLAEMVNTRDGHRPRVQETDPDEEIYDKIGNGGTLSRQIGKKLKRIHRVNKTMPNGYAEHRVTFNFNDGSDGETIAKTYY
ncbi:chitin synthase I [Mactra antiquata]